MTKPEAKPAPLMLARIPNTKHGRATLAGIREFLNAERYKLDVEFSGPRRKTAGGWMRYGTLKADATAFRLYVTRKHTKSERAAQHESDARLCDRIIALESKLLELLAEVEQTVRERADAAVQWNRANQAEQDRDIAQDELSAIPRWVRALFAWMKRNQICQPYPRG